MAWRPIKIFSKREDFKYLEKGNETIIFFVLHFDYFRYLSKTTSIQSAVSKMSLALCCDTIDQSKDVSF